MSQAVKELVGKKSTTILQRMQRSVISSTLNIARRFKGLLLKCSFLQKISLYIEIFIETFSMILP